MSWKLKKKAQGLVASEEGVAQKDWGGRVRIALVYANRRCGSVIMHLLFFVFDF